MNKRRFFLYFLAVVLMVSSVVCSTSPATPKPEVDEDLAATLVSMQTTQTALAAAPSATLPPASTPVAPAQFGSLSGSLSYPSEGIPPLRVVATRTDNAATYFAQETANNQNVYRFENLAPGFYYVVAYTLDGKLAGGYTQAVLCGLSAACTDHSLVAVEVKAGQETGGINPGDWYAPPGAFPVDPTTPTSADGSLSGTLSFPSEGIPALRIVAFNQNGSYQYIQTAANQSSYKIEDLPAGVYRVVAYTLDGNFVGGYSQAVLCGLTAACTDHTLVAVTVTAGQDTPNVNPGDWYAPPGSFPADPTQPPQQLGSISGKLAYPSEGIPPLRVVAFNLQTGLFYFVDTVTNQSTYVIDGLPTGVYHVVAYAGGSLSGGYTQAVPCGLSASCTDHSLIDITVNPGQQVVGVDPGDWYAPQGAFPPNPAP